MALKNFVEPGFLCSLVYQRHWDPRQIEQAGAQTEVAGRPVDRAVASQRSSSQCADDNERRSTWCMPRDQHGAQQIRNIVREGHHAPVP